MIRLGVNIDHVATVRQARRTDEPDPVWAAALAELGGADGIVAHLREDRRHVQERDVRLLRQTVAARLNLEMAADEAVVALALELKPAVATLVPERREEVTTEGGLDVAGQQARLREVVARLRDGGVPTMMFIDADPRQIEASAQTGARGVEFHTGEYALHPGEERHLAVLREAASRARQGGLEVAAGHGLTYRNVQPVAAIPEVEELNIGHAIVSRAVFVGMERAVREMKQLMLAARGNRGHNGEDKRGH